MVVLGLYAYIFQKNLQRNISLEDLARTYRNKRRRAMVVVDAIAILSRLFQELTRSSYGGQWSEYVRRIECFVERTKDLHMEFVYYFDGSYREKSLFERQVRKEHQTSRITSTFGQAKGFQESHHSRTLKTVTPGIMSYFRYLLKYKFGCDVRTSLIDLRQEIARFAADTDDCMAIIADDADYLIFETKPLLSAKSLDPETMETLIFYRSKLIRATGLDGKQLPLLSCTLGNKVTQGQLKRFHDSLKTSSESGRFITNEAVKYIKDKGWEGRDDELQEIAKQMEILEGTLRKGMSYYDLPSLDAAEEPFPLLREKCASCCMPAPLLTLLVRRKNNHGSTVEDPEDSHLPPAAKVFRDIRRRMYFLLYEGEETFVEEHCVYKDNDFADPELVSPLSIEINEEIPSIHELLLGNVDEELRWKLFAACMGVTIPLSCLRRIEPRLLPMCSILNFLIQNEEIEMEEWEVKAFIYQAIRPHPIDVSEMEIELTPRAMSLSGIFLRGVTTIIQVIPVCGYPIPFEEAMPWEYLEGEVFHYAYNRLKNNSNAEETIKNLCVGDEAMMEKLGKVYRTATLGTLLGGGDCDVQNE